MFLVIGEKISSFLSLLLSIGSLGLEFFGCQLLELVLFVLLFLVGNLLD